MFKSIQEFFQDPKSKTIAYVVIAMTIGGMLLDGQGTNNPSPPPRKVESVKQKMQKTAEQERKDKMLTAQVCAQQKVKQELKAPRTAKFPWVSTADIVTEVSSNKFLVKSYVDAENSFGAMLRTHYGCAVEVFGDTDCSVECLYE